MGSRHVLQIMETRHPDGKSCTRAQFWNNLRKRKKSKEMEKKKRESSHYHSRGGGLRLQINCLDEVGMGGQSLFFQWSSSQRNYPEKKNEEGEREGPDSKTVKVPGYKLRTDRGQLHPKVRQKGVQLSLPSWRRVKKQGRPVFF